MFGTCVNLQLAEHRSPQRILGQHPLDSAFVNAFWSFLQKIVHRDRLDIADIARSTVVKIVGLLPAGRPHFVGVDHNDVVTGIDMRGILGFVLNAQEARNFARQPAKNLVRGVDHVPVALDLGRLGAESFHCNVLRKVRVYLVVSRALYASAIRLTTPCSMQEPQKIAISCSRCVIVLLLGH